MRTRRISLTAAIACAIAAAAAPAQAATHRQVCAPRATLVASPGGIPVATLLRGESVAVLRRGEDRTWVRVRTSFGSKGWLRTGHLCRPGQRP